MQNSQTMTIEQFSAQLKADKSNDTVAKVQELAERVNSTELQSAHKKLQDNVNRYGWR